MHATAIVDSGNWTYYELCSVVNTFVEHGHVEVKSASSARPNFLEVDTILLSKDYPGILG